MHMNEGLDHRHGDTSEKDFQDTFLIELTSEVVAAYVSKNVVHTGELPELIRKVHGALKNSTSPAAVAIADPEPAVPVKKSVRDDHITCLECGGKFKSLKRHLAGHGMSPGEYREKWNLSSDYPMVAPHYSAKRSMLAKSTGLGRKSGAGRMSNAA